MHSSLCLLHIVIQVGQTQSINYYCSMQRSTFPRLHSPHKTALYLLSGDSSFKGAPGTTTQVSPQASSWSTPGSGLLKQTDFKIQLSFFSKWCHEISYDQVKLKQCLTSIHPIPNKGHYQRAIYKQWQSKSSPRNSCSFQLHSEKKTLALQVQIFNKPIIRASLWNWFVFPETMQASWYCSSIKAPKCGF